MAGKVLSADEAAAAVAEKMYKGGGAVPNSQMEAEGGLASKAPGKPIVKADEEEGAEDDYKEACDTKKADNEEEDEIEEEEEEEEEKSNKSFIASDDLMKAMDVLEATAEGMGHESDRRAELAEKVADGTISKSEREELYELLGTGTDEDNDEVEKSFSETFANDEQLSTDYDVAPFIERHSQMVAEALDSMRDTMAKSTTEQQLFNRALAKSFKGIGQVVAEQGELIKSLHDQNAALSERLGTVENTPMQRKAHVGGNVKPLRKSFQGQPQAGELSANQVFEGFNRLMEKSRNNGFRAPCGLDIASEVARFESTGVLLEPMRKDVTEALNQ